MNGKPIIRRTGPRITRTAASEIAIGAAAVGGFMLLARALEFDGRTRLDLAVRRVARSGMGPTIGRAMNPLFPLGLPGSYITIAYLIARRLRNERRHGGPAIVASGWLGWLVHRLVKEFYFRQRPPCGRKPNRSDSYPSGHTTGVTALASTIALVLSRQKSISPMTTGLIGVGAPGLMGVFRVLADDHWATDVVGGWMLGAAIGLTCDAVLGETGGALHDVRELETSTRARRRRRSGQATYVA
jgi:membrane-associated phospholipid phosphatase